jgi:hypothetical protein
VFGGMCAQVTLEQQAEALFDPTGDVAEQALHGIAHLPDVVFTVKAVP